MSGTRKLPEVVLQRLTTEVAKGCENAIPDHWLLYGRHTLLADGTTATMADTQSNQDEYPQNVAQKPGLGFPIVRLVLLLSLATGMVQSMALGPYAGKETGETALFRQLLAGVDPQTIFLADRYYCSYFLIAMALSGQRDFVVRLHQRREVNLSKAQRLGPGDHLVVWTRPARPAWMDQASYKQIPESMTVRLVEVSVEKPGFRVKSLWVVTTLMDAGKYRKEEIADLYRHRWLSRTRHSHDQENDGDGRLAVQVAQDGAWGDLDLSVGLQSDSQGAAGGRLRKGAFAAGTEFHHGAADDCCIAAGAGLGQRRSRRKAHRRADIESRRANRRRSS